MKYYGAYEDRYRRVYAQGVKYWTNDPDEIGKSLRAMEDFLRACHLEPNQSRVIECGCGEGHLAAYFLARGYNYLGIDISPSAIEKAKERVLPLGGRAQFLVADVTQLKMIPDASRDVLIDNQCLHMLVVDSDRQKYLRHAARILTPGGKAFFHESFHADAFEGPIRDFAEYLAVFQPDLQTLEDRAAYSGGQHRTIKLPRVPARPRSEAAYREELHAAGLRVELFRASQGTCVMYAAW